MTMFEELCKELGISKGTEAEKKACELVNELLIDENVPLESINEIVIKKFQSMYA